MRFAELDVDETVEMLGDLMIGYDTSGREAYDKFRYDRDQVEAMKHLLLFAKSTAAKLLA
jgi:hypothetical protein